MSVDCRQDYLKYLPIAVIYGIIICAFMKKNNQNSLDGFVPRRADDGLGEKRFQSKTSQKSHSNSHMSEKTDRMTRTDIQTSSGQARKELGRSTKNQSINTKDISESLKLIDNEGLEPAKNNKKSKKSRHIKTPSSKKKIIKRFIFLLLVIILLIAGYLGFKAFNASGKVFRGNLLGIVKQEKLKQDANGRTNILVFGTSPADHDGANLTDSIMVLSVNQQTKDSFMISLPRDLWVKYASICTVGNAGKLNAAYFCASNDSEDENAGVQALEAQAEKILGLEIQYFAHVNWDALTQAVDAVGGVDVTIETDDPRGILDRNFDWTCNYKCYYVKYDKGETVHLDGIHALALARARGAAGGYGLSGGNFDREQNQQKIIKALQQKALSVGTLTNVSKVTGLIDALGDNLKTNISTGEIRTVMDVAANMKPEDMVSLSLVDEDNPLVTTSNISGQSVVVPIAGTFDYSQIQAYIKKHSITNEVSREGAEVAVYNATGQSGLASDTGEALTNVGYNVVYLGDASADKYSEIVIYQTTGTEEDFAKTRIALEKRFHTTVRFAKPEFSVKSSINFVIVLGDVPVEPSTSKTN